MPHTLFIVHGIGAHDENWSDGIQTLLQEKYAGIPSEAGQSLEDFITFKPVRYDQIFDKALARMAQKNAEISSAVNALDLAGSFFGKFSDMVGKLGGDNFFTTHALDVFFYRYTPLRGYVQALLAAEFLDALKPTQVENIDWSIICHSMGTSVVHDTLHNLFTTRFEDSAGTEMQLNPSNQFIKVYAALANVSRLLEVKRARAYSSLVRPRQAEVSADGKGLIQNFINARHRFDPIALIRQFDPAQHWYQTHATRGFHNIELKAVYQADVHGFEHYLSNPKVYYPLLKMITSGMAEQDEFNTLVTAYEAGSIQGKFHQARELFEDLNGQDFVQDILAGKSPFEELTTQLGDIGNDIKDMIELEDGDGDE